MAQQTVGELIADVASGAKSIVDGLWVTFYNFARRKRVTDQYPHKDPEDDYKPGPGYRGMLGLVTNPETGELNCTACGQCQKICHPVSSSLGVSAATVRVTHSSRPEMCSVL